MKTLTRAAFLLWLDFSVRPRKMSCMIAGAWKQPPCSVDWLIRLLCQSGWQSINQCIDPENKHSEHSHFKSFRSYYRLGKANENSGTPPRQAHRLRKNDELCGRKLRKEHSGWSKLSNACWCYREKSDRSGRKWQSRSRRFRRCVFGAIAWQWPTYRVKCWLNCCSIWNFSINVDCAGDFSSYA